MKKIVVALVVQVLLAAPLLFAQGRPRAEVTPLLERDGAQPGGRLRAALAVRLPEGLHANANKPRDPSLIPMELRIEPPEGLTVEEIVWPTPTDLKQEGSPLPLAVFEREFLIGVSFKLAPGMAPGSVVVPATFVYQACDDKMCYIPQRPAVQWTVQVLAAGAQPAAVHGDVFGRIPFGSGEAPPSVQKPAAEAPRADEAAKSAGDVKTALSTIGSKFSVAGVTNYVGTEDFLSFIANAEAGVVERGWFEGRGPFAILALVLLGGLALNLTPCVLPMIPINLAIIGAGAQAGSRVRGLLLGATYGGAMAIAYGALGLIVILTAGTFGSINASPWFNTSIAALFVVLGLAMFDVFTIDFSGISNRMRLGESGRGTFVLAFTMGAVAALLAGACVAPVVIQVLLLSSNLYAAGTTVALALPFFLGAGMAIPWPIAGAGIAALPRPGAWMVRVKQAFGIFILGTAVYYGYTAYGLFASRWVDPAEVASSVEEKLKEGWYASLPAGIAAAEKEGKPVLIDFWATWCKNCLLMDRTTLKDERVSAALASYVKIKFQAEDPDQSPAKEAMDHFNAVGLPTYVILKPADN
jgi:thiol:disulfide interchange protein